jgi:hypothetical protein
MYTVTGSFKNGVATPDEPVAGYEGQAVLITFLAEDLADGSTKNNSHEVVSEKVRPALEEIVAWIAASGRSASYIPPTASLAELLSNDTNGIVVDPEEWDHRWAEIEAEIDRISLEDEEQEGLLG